MYNPSERAHTLLGQVMKDTEADKVLAEILDLDIEDLIELLHCLAEMKNPRT